jgi:hypothetical protein
VTKWFYRIQLGIGCGFLVASAALYIVFDGAAFAEQARSRGEKSLGVAALAMMYWPPILIAAHAGLLALLLGMSLLAFHRLRNPN